VDGRGGATWLNRTYEAATGLLFWPTGIRFPIPTAQTVRGDNLYTNTDLALDAKTGQLR
jgi:glucose dehydrogenase